MKISLPRSSSAPLESWCRPRMAWLIPVLFAGFVAWFWDRAGSSSSPIMEKESVEAADTFIPAGFVLVPIEVANYEALDSILGKFGVVDLYLPPAEPGKKPVKAAERVKILRAPLNPRNFAVLAPEEESARLVAAGSAFTVIVQNPKRAGTGLEKPNHKGGASATHRGPTGPRAGSRIEVETFDAE